MLLISQNKIPLIASKYIETSIIPKASGLTKAMAWGSIFVANNLINNFFKEDKNTKLLKMSGIMQDDGLIDIDSAHETLKFIIQHEPKIEIFG